MDELYRYDGTDENGHHWFEQVELRESEVVYTERYMAVEQLARGKGYNMEKALVFWHEQFGEIRVIDRIGDLWFVAKDVAVALGYAKPENAVAAHCKKTSTTPKQGGGFMNIIPESDVYRLIMRSNLPEAERFQDWVIEEVLPSIRKHGGYLTPAKIEEALSDPDTIIRLATTLKAERETRIALETKTEADRPKVIFADAVDSSTTSILVGDLAKILRQNDILMGQNRLFSWMRDNDYLVKRGDSRNMPTQRAMEMGLFEIKERTINNPDGSIRITKTTKVTGRGQIYFINAFKGAEIPDIQ